MVNIVEKWRILFLIPINKLCKRFILVRTVNEEEQTMTQLKIGIILGSTRQGRVSPQVGEWVKSIADKRGDAEYEIVDIADYNLPFVYTTAGDEPGIKAWVEKVTELDGYRIYYSRI